MTDRSQESNGVPKLFGTDGVRGRANVEPVTAETALKLGRAAAHVFRKDARRHVVVVGKDTRLSGYMLENAMVAGLLSMGVDVLVVGPLPTPGVPFITRSLRADAGIMLTASHNTYEDNGIKFFRHDGYKLDDELESEIERLVFSGEIDRIRPTERAIGKAHRIDDALGRYVEFVKNSFPKGMTLEGMEIVVDTANGAAYKAAPCVLRELGATIYVYNNQPDGTNINLGCGSTHPEVARKGVIDHAAAVGITHDGDGDRVIFCDENAQVVDGDQILAILALDHLQQGQLNDNTVVATVMSNAGLIRAVEQAGGHVVRVPVGDKYVLHEMLARDLNLGGEQSGHILCRDHTTTGDGLITALQVLRIMRSTGKSLAQLCRCMEKFPQVNLNLPIRERVPIESIEGLAETIEDVEKRLGGEGRVLVRYSGTQPQFRIQVEGRDGAPIEQYAQRIARVIGDRIGA